MACRNTIIAVNAEYAELGRRRPGTVQYTYVLADWFTE